MIQSFACQETERFFLTRASRSIPSTIQRVALRKLAQVHAVTELAQLSIPPGNRLEALKGGRAGRHSIRINDQWRICFRWAANGPYDVEIVDYH
jgi:proteic killer suppression protein